jgi:hypothetical protein
MSKSNMPTGSRGVPNAVTAVLRATKDKEMHHGAIVLRRVGCMSGIVLNRGVGPEPSA